MTVLFAAQFIVVLATQVIVLSGFVHDRTTSQALPHVTVSAGSAHATTDASGHYALRGLHPGSLTIRLESDDVPPQTFTVVVGKTATHHDFTACSTTLDYSCSPVSP